MSKKALRVLSIVEMVVAIATYFVLIYEYSTNKYILKISVLNTPEAKAYCIALYAIPCIHLIAGLAAFIFNEHKKLMIFFGILLCLTALPHMTVIIGDLSNIRAIVSLVCGLLYLISAITLPKTKTLKSPQ